MRRLSVQTAEMWGSLWRLIERRAALNSRVTGVTLQMTVICALQHMTLNSSAEDLGLFSIELELGHSFGRKRWSTSAKSEEEECFVQCWNLVDKTGHYFHAFAPCADIQQRRVGIQAFSSCTQQETPLTSWVAARCQCLGCSAFCSLETISEDW